MENTDRITTDAIFEVLSSSRRRRLLYHLYDRDGEAHLRDLAEDTAADEFGRPLEEDQIKRIYIAFYQTHIPKLEELKLISYDRDEQWVTLEDTVEELAHVLPAHPRHVSRWPLVYAFVGVISVAVGALGWMNMTWFADATTVSALALALGISLIAVSALHMWVRMHGHRDYSFLERLVNQ